MNPLSPGILIKTLAFTGTHVPRADLSLEPGLNVLYGSSNTGKSFAVKALDFMLGSSRSLPEIEEREGYERAWLSLDLPSSGHVTLLRALAGGSFQLHVGHADSPGEADQGVRQLSARHDHTSADNLSQFLLQELGFGSKFIAIDTTGKKRSLSFRDLARFCIVDETTIQSETSPAEAGQYQSVTAERSVFKLLLTGTDDSAITPVVDRKSFRTATK
jgi:hypothetical protein